LFFYNQFNDWDPLSGPVVIGQISYLTQVVSRARKLLDFRRTEQLSQLAEFLDTMVEDCISSQLGVELNRHTIELNESIELDGEPFPRDYLSDVSLLKKRFEEIEISGFDDYECFAVLALWKASDAMRWEGKLLTVSFQNAIEAMEAVCYAEQLKSEDLYQLAVDHVRKTSHEKRSLQTSLAGQKRHRRSNELKNLAEALYSDGTWKSVRQAMTTIYPDIEQHAEKIGYRIQSNRFEKTIYDHLCSFKRILDSASKLEK
jgi:hypothetical protein